MKRALSFIMQDAGLAGLFLYTDSTLGDGAVEMRATAPCDKPVPYQLKTGISALFMYQPALGMVLFNPFCSESCILHSENITFSYRLFASVR